MPEPARQPRRRDFLVGGGVDRGKTALLLKLAADWEPSEPLMVIDDVDPTDDAGPVML